METILIFRIGNIGDTVVALPCFHLVEQAFPAAKRILLSNINQSDQTSGVMQVLGNSGFVHGSIEYPADIRNPGSVLRLARRIRETGAKTLIYVADRRPPQVPRDVAFFKLCGIKTIIGASVRQDLLRCRMDRRTGRYEREAERLLRCLGSLGAIDMSSPRSWDLRLTPDEVRAAGRALGPLSNKPFVAFNMGGKVARKDWGDDNWRSLLDRLVGMFPGFGLLAVGAGIDRVRHAALLSRWAGVTVNACGELSPRESAAALRTAKVFIGHDSGPLHLAAAVGAPCVGLYGDFNTPEVWYPVGGRFTIVHEMRGIRKIAADQVAAAVVAWVNRTDDLEDGAAAALSRVTCVN
jgi:ADP-heptose:LPS heptosyltransferase